MNNKPHDEMAAYERFQKIYFPFLRNDRIAASVAMNKCKLLISQTGRQARKEIERQLDIILANAGANDWEFHYFCGLTYLHHLSSPEKACVCLQKAVNYLEFSFSNMINGYYNEVDSGKERNYSLNDNRIHWDSSTLSICRTQLLQAMSKCKSDEELGEYFINLLGNMTVSSFEFFPYFVKSGLYACPFLDYIHSSAYFSFGVVWGRTDDFDMILPTRFFYSGFNPPTIRFLSEEKLVGEEGFHNGFFDRGLRYTEVGPGCPWRGFKDVKSIFRAIEYHFRYELDELEDKNVDCIDIEFKNSYHTIVLRFASGTPRIFPQATISKMWIVPTHVICDGTVIELNKSYPTLNRLKAARIVRDYFGGK